MKTAEKIKNQSLVLNAPLTPNGIEQAKKAGKKLNDYLKGARIQPVDFTFASDLQRAQYTVANMFVQLERRFINPTYSDKYILPCSHEIVGKRGNCDNASDITWAENTPTKLDVDNILNKKLNLNNPAHLPSSPNSALHSKLILFLSTGCSSSIHSACRQRRLYLEPYKSSPTIGAFNPIECAACTRS